MFPMESILINYDVGAMLTDDVAPEEISKTKNQKNFFFF